MMIQGSPDRRMAHRYTVSHTRIICVSVWLRRKRPYAKKGQLFQVTGIVGQFGTSAPWNDGYRVLVRYQSDLVRIENK